MEDLGKEHPAVKAAHAMADAHSQHETAVPAIRQVAGLLPALDDEQLTDEQLMLIWIGVNAKYLANAESNTKRERATELEYLTWWR
ncbi:MAG: hypothetical protein GY862_01905, partial [Gammaproteobacteria bacterium]|nr:hypothetical protein [Gammaproteobacteria bacterium]